eukprot:scaffold3044_cov176-Ochromonas_danica.AAC.26
MSEVHIEFSNTLRFAPFNGGYAEHAQHLQKANLDLARNLWYDIYDHNDPGKTHANWSLLPEDQYEAPWFPAGSPCDIAVPRTKPGSVQIDKEESMQSFSVQDMVNDARKLGKVPPAPVAASQVPPPLPQPVAQPQSDEEQIKKVIAAFIRLTKGSTLNGIVGKEFNLFLPLGEHANQEELESKASSSPQEIIDYGEIVVAASKDLAYSTALAQEAPAANKGPADPTLAVLYTLVLDFLKREEKGIDESVSHIHNA